MGCHGNHAFSHSPNRNRQVALVLTVVTMSILSSNTYKMCYMIYISKVTTFKFTGPQGRIRPALRPQDTLSWASNCFVGPPSIGESIAQKLTPFWL